MASDIKITDTQHSAINCIDGHLQIIACAGSGKTEVISRRIVNIMQSDPNIQPANIVAFTFTEKAAASLKRRIERILGGPVEGMYVGTIHSFCKYLLSTYTEEFSEYKVLDTVKNHLFISRFADKCGMTELGLKSCLLNNNLFLQCIDKLIDDRDNRDRWDDIHNRALDRYIDCLYEHKYIDFSLLLYEALRQMEENHAVQEYLRTIRHLVVDEYKKTD